MPDITYGPAAGGGYQATVPGAGGFPLGGGYGDFDWLTDLARKSAQNKLRKQNLELKMMQRGYQNPAGLGQTDFGDEQLRGELAATEMAKARALRSAAPMKWYGRGGWSSGLVEDPDVMSGIQRQIFLPQNAGFEGPSLSEMDEVGRNRSISDLQRMNIEDLERQAATASLIGGNPSRESFEWRRRMGSMGGPTTGRGGLT
jgi:hypothetical protein